MSKPTRRQFLAISAAAVAAPLVIPRSVLGSPAIPGANDTVKIAAIGLGGRFRGIFGSAVKPVAGVKFVAACDIFQPRIDSFLGSAKDDGIKGYDDFRKMIETEKPDGVMVETATHQRAWISAYVMQMGAHLYIEKPMCLTIAEGRYLVNAAKKYNRVTQVGTQQRSLPLCMWACQKIQDGALGKIKVIEAPNFVGPNQWEEKPGQPLPEGGKDGWWDIWLNQSKVRPYHHDLQFGWDRWWDYDAGGTCFGVSGWGTHSYDQVNMVMKTNDTGPTKILLEEPCTMQDSGKFANRKLDDEETGGEYYGMAKVTGPRAKMKMWFENGVELRLNLDGDRGPGLGCIVVGEKGKMEVNRHKVTANPKSLLDDMPDDAKNQRSRDETVYHVENWVDCMKTGAKCNADIEYGQRSTTICELVNIVRATAPVGKVIGWDPVKEQFVGNDKGNEMLSRPRRKEYELPELV